MEELRFHLITSKTQIFAKYLPTSNEIPLVNGVIYILLQSVSIARAGQTEISGVKVSVLTSWSAQN